nr:Gfo/Idh/MocA family oxidoreductase [Microlunatus panaciterrae]
MRVIQVGAGGMGRAWLATIAASDDVDLVGLVDLDLAVARAAADAAGFTPVPVATSLTELMDSTRAQAVINVTVPQAHLPVNVEALFAGLPVLCEKPAAPTVADALVMVAAAEASGRLLMISQSRRYFNHLLEFKRLADRLGPVGSLSCEFFKGPHFGGFRETMPQPLLVDMAIHQFDLARLLLGAEPVAVYCETYNPSWSWFGGDAAATAVFEFEGGARFNYHGSWCSPGLETSWNGSWRVSTAAGSALWDGDTPPVVEAPDDPSVQVQPSPTGPEQIAGSLAEFVGALRTGATPQGVVRANVLSLAMVEAAVRSADTGRRVMITEVLEGAYAEARQAPQDERIRSELNGWSSVAEALSLRAGR